MFWTSKMQAKRLPCSRITRTGPFVKYISYTLHFQIDFTFTYWIVSNVKDELANCVMNHNVLQMNSALTIYSTNERAFISWAFLSGDNEIVKLKINFLYAFYGMEYFIRHFHTFYGYGDLFYNWMLSKTLMVDS